MNRTIPINALDVFNKRLSEEADANVQTVSLIDVVRRSYQQIKVLRGAGKPWRAIAEILNDSIQEFSSDIVIKSASLRACFCTVSEEMKTVSGDSTISPSFSLVADRSRPLEQVEDTNESDGADEHSKEFELPSRSHSSGWKEPKFNL